MAFADLSDDTGTVSLVIFPKIYSQTRGLWIPDQPVLVEGRVDFRQDSLSVVVERVVNLKKQEEQENEDLPVIRVPKGVRPIKLVALNEFLQANKGEQEITLEFENGNGEPRKMRLPYGVAWSKSLKEEIGRLLK